MSTLLEYLASLLLVAGLTLGLAWPFAVRLVGDAMERITVSAALSLPVVYLVAWGVYVFDLPANLLWALPVFAAGGLVIGRRTLVASWRDPSGRDLLIAQFLVTVWCLGWLTLVVSYSGGGWAGDWYEHWERTRFFLERGPLDQKFLGSYPLAARPPLANVVTGAFLWLTRNDFAHYQFVSTVLGSLVFLPAALLARRFGGGRRATAGLALLFMVNPLFVQNAAFAWTKLPAAFFILAALHFFLRSRDGGAARTSLLLCAVLLAAGLVTHYSAGPYAVMLALAWLVFQPPHARNAVWWRTTTLAALAGALVLATWFGWSFAAYGASGTLLSNSSITSSDMHRGNQLVKISLNLFDTFVPHFLRSFDPALIAQRSAWGWGRDVCFQCYQLCLPLAFGSVAWLAIIRELARAARETNTSVRWFWAAFVTGVVLLGVATHGQRDHWGLTHICLQALVLLGLSFLAARWRGLGRAWRVALAAGATVDFAIGIALHFAVQNFALDRWFAGGRTADDLLTSYNETALMNLAAKLQHHVNFIADVWALPFAIPAVALGMLLCLGIGRARASSV